MGNVLPGRPVFNVWLKACVPRLLKFSYFLARLNSSSVNIATLLLVCVLNMDEMLFLLVCSLLVGKGWGGGGRNDYLWQVNNDTW